jgi:hypothetical protein
MFGWRFVPTLIAVFYTQLTTMMFDDAKRTEPFARLARPGDVIPQASHTLLETPREWYKTLAHGFRKEKNGGKRSWVIILACLINVLAFMGISPLSSALLDPEEIHIRKTMRMNRLAPKEGTNIQPIAERDTYFRTTGAVLQDVETSAWISDEYSVLPFWPSASTESLWDRHLTPRSQTWRAETMVYRTDLRCSKLEFKGADATNSSDGITDFIFLESAKGCQYNLTFSWKRSTDDLLFSWSALDDIAYKSSDLKDILTASYNDNCDGNEVIIVSKRGLNDSENYLSSLATNNVLRNQTSAGYMCRSGYTMATIPVIASVSQTDFKIDIDTELFRKSQQDVPETLMNRSQFSDLLRNREWYSYIPSPAIIAEESWLALQGQESLFSGAAALLATKYNFNDAEMFDDASLPEKAASIRRRHFGEVLRTSLEAQDTSKIEDIVAEVTSFERRILVRLEAAVILSTLFFSSFLMFLVVIWSSRLSRRPLNLRHDPATVLGTTSLVASSAGVLFSLKPLDQANESELKRALENRRFATYPGHLYEIHKHQTREIAGK